MNFSNLRNQRIDFLRGVAILLVLILHFNISYHLAQSALDKVFSPGFIQAIARNGNYGVTMFFVISGFLITSTSLERYGGFNKVDLIGFYLLRFARIMPCLLLALSIIVLFDFIQIPIFENKADSTSMFLAVFSILTFWHNILMQKLGYFNYCLNILWSLSVEEIFYIAFPVICLLFKRMRFIIPFWISLMIIGPIYRSFNAHNEIVALYGYFSCFDAIAMGCCAAVFAKKIQFQGVFGRIIQYAAVLLIIIVYLYSGIMANIVIGVSLVAISTALLLIVANNSEDNTKKSMSNSQKIVCWFGKNSYELYLFHIIVLALMKEIYSREALGDYSKLVWMAVFISVSALVSGTVSRFYSQPMNRMLREVFSRFRSPVIANEAKQLA